MKPLTPLKAAILAAGFVENEYHLDLNHALQDPAPRYPRSRMFKWPISVDRYEDRLTICHPAIAMEAFPARVMATLRVAFEIEPDPAAGLNTPWHHAVDLATDRDWRDLLATRDYTTTRAIMRGTVIGILHGGLSAANARAILAEIVPDDVEPDDRSAHALSHWGGFIRPGFIDTGVSNGKAPTGNGRWSINLHSRRDPIGEAWAAIHGAEDGWFKREKSGGYHWMSVEGMARHMKVMVPR